MSQEHVTFSRTILAGADLSANQNYFVKKDSNGNAVLCSVLGEASEGVLYNAPGNGEACTIAQYGTKKVVAGGTVAVGAWVTTDAAGKAVATTTAGHVVRGRALESAVAGDVFEIELCLFVL